MSVYERHTLSNGLRVLTAPLEHAQSVACYIMLAAGSRYENAVEPRHRPLRGAHVLQGHGAPAHRARPLDGSRQDRRRVQRVHLEGVHGLLHPLRGRAARHRARRARRHVAQLEVRPRGARAREGRDPRGDEHVLRHAARLRRLGVRGADVRLEPARLGDARHARDDQGRDARDVHGLHRRAGTRRRAWSSASRAWSATTCSRGSKSCSATCRGTATARRRRQTCRTRPSRRSDFTARTPTRRTSASASRSTRSTHPDRYALQMLGTVLGTGMSSRLFLEVREQRGLAYYVYALNSSFTDAGTLVSQAGVDLHRADEAVRVIAHEFHRLAEERVPDDELEKARALAKGRFVLQTESPNGLLLFGLRREVLEGRAARAGGAARGPRRRHGRGRAARRAGHHRLERDARRRDRPVRRRGAVPHRAGGLSSNA